MCIFGGEGGVGTNGTSFDWFCVVVDGGRGGCEGCGTNCFSSG